MKNKNFILILILIVSVFAEFCLTYIRYSNQSLYMENFSILKTGNLISLLDVILVSAFVVSNVISKAKYRMGHILSLLFIASVGLVCIVGSFVIPDKDVKLVLYVVFFIFKLFVIVSLVLLSFSNSKKLHVFNSLGYVVLLLVGIFAITFYFVYTYSDDSALYKKGNRKSDAGVILGAAVWGGNRPSPVLRERINKGFEIYQQKYAPRLILTGGGSPGELTEAEVSRNELVKFGVDPRNLLVEAKSNSTLEQILFVRDRYYRKMNFGRIIIVSDNFHLMRASEICRFNMMNVDTFASDTPLSTESNMNFCVKETFAIIVFWLFGLG
ncbi:MAG: YdcF family protein [Bacteroidetes bacterium]|nr:YdcF family protein [Bacteroidota bacterium]